MNLICYLTNGNPSIEGTIEMAKTYVASGCDIIEVDLPAQDPAGSREGALPALFPAC